jgi:hypothetical protein
LGVDALAPAQGAFMERDHVAYVLIVISLAILVGAIAYLKYTSRDRVIARRRHREQMARETRLLERE